MSYLLTSSISNTSTDVFSKCLNSIESICKQKFINVDMGMRESASNGIRASVTALKIWNKVFFLKSSLRIPPNSFACRLLCYFAMRQSENVWFGLRQMQQRCKNSATLSTITFWRKGNKKWTWKLSFMILYECRLMAKIAKKMYCNRKTCLPHSTTSFNSFKRVSPGTWVFETDHTTATISILFVRFFHYTF